MTDRAMIIGIGVKYEGKAELAKAKKDLESLSTEYGKEYRRLNTDPKPLADMRNALSAQMLKVRLLGEQNESNTIWDARQKAEDTNRQKFLKENISENASAVELAYNEWAAAPNVKTQNEAWEKLQNVIKVEQAKTSDLLVKSREKLKKEDFASAIAHRAALRAKYAPPVGGISGGGNGSWDDTADPDGGAGGGKGSSLETALRAFGGKGLARMYKMSGKFGPAIAGLAAIKGLSVGMETVQAVSETVNANASGNIERIANATLKWRDMLGGIPIIGGFINTALVDVWKNQEKIIEAAQKAKASSSAAHDAGIAIYDANQILNLGNSSQKRLAAIEQERYKNQKVQLQAIGDNQAVNRKIDDSTTFKEGLINFIDPGGLGQKIFGKYVDPKKEKAKAQQNKQIKEAQDNLNEIEKKAAEERRQEMRRQEISIQQQRLGSEEAALGGMTYGSEKYDRMERALELKQKRESLEADKPGSDIDKTALMATHAAERAAQEKAIAREKGDRLRDLEYASQTEQIKATTDGWEQKFKLIQLQHTKEIEDAQKNGDNLTEVFARQAAQEKALRRDLLREREMGEFSVRAGGLRGSLRAGSFKLQQMLFDLEQERILTEAKLKADPVLFAQALENKRNAENERKLSLAEKRYGLRYDLTVAKAGLSNDAGGRDALLMDLRHKRELRDNAGDEESLKIIKERQAVERRQLGSRLAMQDMVQQGQSAFESRFMIGAPGFDKPTQDLVDNSKAQTAFQQRMTKALETLVANHIEINPADVN